MGKIGHKGQKGFTKGSKSNHSYHNLDRRSYLAKNKSAATAAVVSTASPINASHDRAANCHPPIVDGSDSDRSDSDSDDDYEKRPSRSNSTPASATPNNNSEKRRKTISTGMDSCRKEVVMRQLISLYYVHVLGAPPQEEWEGNAGTISIIMKDLKISNGSRDTIFKVLKRTNDAIDCGEEYDGARKRGSGGHNKLITDTLEIKKVLDYSEFQSLSHFEISVIEVWR